MSHPPSDHDVPSRSTRPNPGGSIAPGSAIAPGSPSAPGSAPGGPPVSIVEGAAGAVGGTDGASPAFSRLPPPLASGLSSEANDWVAWLRAEVAASPVRARQARLLGEVGEIEERGGDEPSAARDYLAAFNADPTFREPLEGLVRLLERRRSFRNLGKVLDAFVKSSKQPEEASRALLMKAAFAADVTKDDIAARDAALLATKASGAGPESALAWLTVEVLAGKLGETDLRREAFAKRIRHSSDPTWRGLLTVDLGHLAAEGGDVTTALALFREAEGLGGAATFPATVVAARLARRHGVDARAVNSAGPEPRAGEAVARTLAYAEALERQAGLIRDAIASPERGDALGVPRWARHQTHLVDAWLRAADARVAGSDLDEAARVLDLAEDALSQPLPGVHGRQDVPDVADANRPHRLAVAAVTQARLRVAERRGDKPLAERLTRARLAAETDPRLASALAFRVAEAALDRGDSDDARQVLAGALARDPSEAANRALHLDLTAVTSDAPALADALEAYAAQLETAEARARLLLVAGTLVGVEGGDVTRAKRLFAQAAAQAPNAGVASAPGIAARLGRLVAAVVGDAAFREEATRDLLANGADEHEQVDLWFEVIRSSFARGAAADAEVSLQALGEVDGGTWLAGALEAFLPGRGTDPTAALDALSELEPGSRGAALTLVAALRARHLGDLEGAKRRLHKRLDAAPDDVVVVTYLAALERGSGAHVAAADTASRGAAATTDEELAAALYLEAGLDRWRGADRVGAIEFFELAARTAPEAAQPLVRWASRGVEVDTVAGRRTAIERAEQAGESPLPLALERYASELQSGDGAAAAAALGRFESVLDASPSEAALRVAGDLAAVVAPERAFSPEAAAHALGRLGAVGEIAKVIAAAETFRAARASLHAAGPARRQARGGESIRAPGGAATDTRHAARAWLDAGGGMAAALEWLASSLSETVDGSQGASGPSPEEVSARRAVAAFFTGDDREALLASAALLDARANPGMVADWVDGASDAVKLANLELSPPGFDLARRSRALTEADAALGADGDAAALAGWSLLADGHAAEALEAFRGAARTGGDGGGSASAGSTKIAAWAGVHAAARVLGDKGAQVEAAVALGGACHDAARSAKFWEEAGLTLLDLGEGDEAEAALEASFRRDPSREVAFDRLFRRVRDRKDGEKLLDLIAKRLDFTDDPNEIVKLYWERSRVLRERGDIDGAMIALENVTMVEPDHVGALALSGEIFIRRGQFAEAADALARLAKIEDAPPKNRATAGIAAVDLFENKLDRSDLALEILVVLHKANLTNLPVRERLARAAAKTGSWLEAASILEELMVERPTPAGRIEAAQLAMAIRRDRLGDRASAGKAMTKLLEESPGNGDAVDLLLDADLAEKEKTKLLRASLLGLIDSIANESPGGGAVRRLARVAQATGNHALEQSALAASVVLGAADDAVRGALARLSQGKARFPRVTLTPAMTRTIVAPGDEGPVAELFHLLGPTLAEAFGPAVAVMGVGRKDRVDPRAGSPVRQEVAAWAGALGVAEFELYVGGRDPLGVQGIPGEPHALVVGADVRSPFPLATRARVARELFAVTRGTNILRLRDESTVLAIVAAACKLADVRLDVPVYAVQAEVDRLLGKAIARKTKKVLPDVCQRIAQSKADARVWSERAVATLDRIAAVATGDVGVVLGDIFGQPAEQLADVVQGDRRSEELLRFVLSPGYLEVRGALGLEGAP